MTDTATIRACLQLIRAPNIFTAVSNIVAAYFVAAGPEFGQAANLALLIAASALLYSGGMILNDCFDYDEDCRERPYRPLPSGAIALSHAWLLGGIALVTGLLLAALAGTTAFVIAAVLAALIITYDGIAKPYRWAAAVMGGCRYTNWLLGLSLFGLQASFFLIALPVFFYVSGLTQLSTVETTARDTRPLMRSVLLIMTGGLMIVFLILSGILPEVRVLVVLLAAVLLILYLAFRTYHDFTPARVQAMVKTLILGIIPLDALLAWAGGNGWWGGLIVLSLLIPGRLLANRLYVT